jgi:hypothetical protein
MLSVLLIATTVGGFSYDVTTLSDQSKPVASAPAGYEATWHERVETIEAKGPRDADFTRFMREQALRARRDYYSPDGDTFESFDHAGSMEVDSDVLAASPDIVSVRIATGYYQAGMAHPDSSGVRYFVWSRRLHRPLRQEDVLAVAPDRALRRLALSRFDNPDGLQNPRDPDGIPLEWNHAAIGPGGITWSFEPYELGGYLSAGSATIAWSSLKPYLRQRLPFAIEAIRKPRR